MSQKGGTNYKREGETEPVTYRTHDLYLLSIACTLYTDQLILLSYCQLLSTSDYQRIVRLLGKYVMYLHCSCKQIESESLINKRDKSGTTRDKRESNFKSGMTRDKP